VQTFITSTQIWTAVGYPLQVEGGTRIHLQTLVIFRYDTNCQLCRAARATTGRQRRHVPHVGGLSARIRRQATLQMNEMSQELIDTIFADEDKLVERKFVRLLQPIPTAYCFYFYHN